MGVIPSTNFNCGKRNLDDHTIDTATWHLNPIAHLEHIVCRELHASKQTQKAILEDEGDDRSRSSQTGQQTCGRLIDDDGNDQNKANDYEDDLQGLEQTLDRLILPRRATHHKRVDGLEHRVYEEQNRNDYIYVDTLVECSDEPLRRDTQCLQRQGQQHLEDKRCYDSREAPHNLVVEDYVVPLHTGLMYHPPNSTHHTPTEE